MSRTITGPMAVALAKQFTNPVYLITQDFGASIVRSSTREFIDYAGNDYVITTGARVESFSADRFAWSLDNSDRGISVLALGNDVGGNDVTLELYYEGEAVTLFVGVLDEWHTQGQRVVFSATSQAAKQQRFPNERAINGTFNHLPAPGSNIQWGQQSVILEQEPN